MYVGYGSFGFMDESYAAGDGTDVWCSTNVKVPMDIISGYSDPTCNQESCFITDTSFIYQPNTKSICLRNFNCTLNFICM